MIIARMIRSKLCLAGEFSRCYGKCGKHAVTALFVYGFSDDCGARRVWKKSQLIENQWERDRERWGHINCNLYKSLWSAALSILWLVVAAQMFTIIYKCRNVCRFKSHTQSNAIDLCIHGVESNRMSCINIVLFCSSADVIDQIAVSKTSHLAAVRSRRRWHCRINIEPPKKCGANNDPNDPTTRRTTHLNPKSNEFNKQSTTRRSESKHSTIWIFIRRNTIKNRCVRINTQKTSVKESHNNKRSARPPSH